jgi:hypothetical protein
MDEQTLWDIARRARACQPDPPEVIEVRGGQVHFRQRYFAEEDALDFAAHEVLIGIQDSLATVSLQAVDVRHDGVEVWGRIVTRGPRG